MTDRELLELAAKAAGLPHQWCDAWSTMAKPRPDGGFFFDKVWNPLTNDGDALRLAVKLKITPRIDGNLTDAESPKSFCTEPHFDDPYAATRRAIVRAIVRAAAEIGRNLP